MTGPRSPRRRSIVALSCGTVALLVWIANLLEVTLLRPRACSLGRMQLESYLLIARMPAQLLPLAGLLLAALARRDGPRLRVLALLLCALGVVVAAAFLRRWLPALQLPCLRD